MDAITVTFLSIGAFALLLMLLSVLGGHLHIGHAHLGHVHLPHLPGTDTHAGGTALTLPAIAGFIGMFGFAGAVVAALLPGYGGRTVLAAAAGLLAGVPAGWLAGRLVRAAIDMPTDATPTSADLVGGMGVVVTDIPADGYGEVRLLVAGQQVKLHARADRPLARGAEIFVIEAPSPTSVLVEPLPHAKDTP